MISQNCFHSNHDFLPNLDLLITQIFNHAYINTYSYKDVTEPPSWGLGKRTFLMHILTGTLQVLIKIYYRNNRSFHLRFALYSLATSCTYNSKVTNYMKKEMLIHSSQPKTFLCAVPNGCLIYSPLSHQLSFCRGIFVAHVSPQKFWCLNVLLKCCSYTACLDRDLAWL